MNKIQKYLLILLTILTCLVVTMTMCLYRALYINPNQIEYHFEEVSHEKIPKELENVSILFFSDLQYGKYQNQERTEKLIQKIQYIDPDLILFGGDLVESDQVIDDTHAEILISYLSKIDAPLGKFAVLGEKDQSDENQSNMVRSIYTKSQFEILENNNVHIGNQSKVGIRLIGLGTSPNYEQAFQNTNTGEFNIVLCHQPDFLLETSLDTKGINLALAGHSHGTQIRYPIFGGYQTIPGAEKLNIDQSQSLSFPVQITSGVGCTKINARFQSDPELIIFTLKSKK